MNDTTTTKKNSCFLISFKKGLGKPAHVYAPDYETAKKEGLAYYLKKSGHSETVDFYSTIENTIESVQLVEE